jgi:hypothetical protein
MQRLQKTGEKHVTFDERYKYMAHLVTIHTRTSAGGTSLLITYKRPIKRNNQTEKSI